MTQADLAARLHITEKTVRNWEQGNTNMNISKMLQVARSLGCDSWEEMIARYIGPSPPNGHGDMIPVLTTIPASFDGDGDVSEAYDFEEAVDYLPGTFRDATDPRMFGLVVDGDSMAPTYPAGCYISCSPRHWHDHGFIDGFRYAIRLKSGETTVKRVNLLDDGRRLELVPVNPAHPTKRISADDVAVAALVRGSYTKEPLPG